MEAYLYRGDVPYRVEQVHERKPDIYFRHIQRWNTGATLDLATLTTDAVERFVYDPRTGRYISQNYADLPLWVRQQEFNDEAERDRTARFDRMTRMMMGPQS